MMQSFQDLAGRSALIPLAADGREAPCAGWAIWPQDIILEDVLAALAPRAEGSLTGARPLALEEVTR